MNETKMTGEVASGATGPRLSARGVIVTAVVGVGIAVGALFAVGAFDDDSGSGASTSAVTTTASTSSAVEAAAEHQAAINEIELRQIELKGIFSQPAAVAAQPGSLEAKLQQLDASANEAFCQSCFDEWLAGQQAQERADARMAHKFAQMDAYDAAFGLR